MKWTESKVSENKEPDVASINQMSGISSVERKSLCIFKLISLLLVNNWFFLLIIVIAGTLTSSKYDMLWSSEFTPGKTVFLN